MSYASVEDVATYLGRSLSPTQEAQAQVYLDAATAWIDQQTGRTWSPSSPTSEQHTLIGEWLQLNNRPITDVTSVTIRAPYPGSDPITLTEGQGWEVLDATRGILTFGGYYVIGGMWGGHNPYLNYIVNVTYTHSISVPANVRLACILMAASKMNASLNPMSQRVQSMNDNRAISVTFKEDEISQEIKDLLPPPKAFVV